MAQVPPPPHLATPLRTNVNNTYPMRLIFIDANMHLLTICP